MKNSTKFIATLLAAGTAGAAAFAFANSQFIADLDGAVILATAAALAISGLAVADYSRRRPSLEKPAPILRPTMPATLAPRATAYGVRRTRQKRLAA